jgi:hypothetical protein
MPLNDNFTVSNDGQWSAQLAAHFGQLKVTVLWVVGATRSDSSLF